MFICPTSFAPLGQRTLNFQLSTKNIYPSTITYLECLSTKGFRYGICLANIYHTYTRLLLLKLSRILWYMYSTCMVYVEATCTIRCALYLSRIEGCYGIWLHVLKENKFLVHLFCTLTSSKVLSLENAQI